MIRGLAALILVLPAGYCANYIYETQPRQRIGSTLRLDSVPASVRNAECESWAVTDVATTCTFDIDPVDFPRLTTGWRFTAVLASGDSYGYAMGPKLGPKFAINTLLSVKNPPEFPHGGHVWLVADARRSRVQVDYFKE